MFHDIGFTQHIEQEWSRSVEIGTRLTDIAQVGGTQPVDTHLVGDALAGRDLPGDSSGPPPNTLARSNVALRRLLLQRTGVTRPRREPASRLMS